jgi:hypothetical protein
MLGTYINFGSGFATSTLGYMGVIVSDLSDPFLLILGVCLGLLAVGYLVRILTKHH